MRILVTGATGFIGRYLIETLLKDKSNHVVAVSRSKMISNHPNLEFRQGDLYSLLDCEQLLEGCDKAIYLVHSMSPSSRLSQGHFRDFDFILADNFAKAAESKGLKEILYVSGIVPDKKDLSAHLASRLEVEQTLCSHKTPVTTFRCGIVIGKGGSSFEMLQNLVDRLPMIALPRWTQTKTQYVYIKDLVDIMVKALNQDTKASVSYDVGSSDSLSYQKLLKTYSKITHRNNIFISLPFIPIKISKLWVRLVTGKSKDLVYPLIESLIHPMIVDPKRQLPESLGVRLKEVDEAIQLSVSEDDIPHLPAQKKSSQHNKESFVQSVQRLPQPKGWSMEDVASYYMTWLPRFLWPFLMSKVEGDRIDIGLRFMKTPLLQLQLSHSRTFSGRELFYVVGGRLSKPHPKARLEFRLSPSEDFFITAIHSYIPRLPWYLYITTQAQIHRWVMSSFGKTLARKFDPKTRPFL